MKSIKRAALSIAAVLVGIGLIGCQLLDDPSTTDIDRELSVGDTITENGIRVTINSVTDLNNSGRYAIHVSIKNTTSSSVDYSSYYSWGALLASDGTQIDSVTSIGYDHYFSGYSILPGATITDVITFSQYTGGASSFTFYAESEMIEGLGEFTVTFRAADAATETT